MKHLSLLTLLILSIHLNLLFNFLLLTVSREVFNLFFSRIFTVVLGTRRRWCRPIHLLLLGLILLALFHLLILYLLIGSHLLTLGCVADHYDTRQDEG